MEQLQSVTSVGAASISKRTAPQWHEASTKNALLSRTLDKRRPDTGPARQGALSVHRHTGSVQPQIPLRISTDRSESWSGDMAAAPACSLSPAARSPIILCMV